METAEALVLAANQAFYDAFSRGDAAAVEALWARRAEVACIHPGWDALRGRDEVLGSWRAILSNGGGEIRCVEPTAIVYGSTATVICGERLGDAELVATNVFVLEDGSWRMVHHQAGPVNRRVERRARPPSGMLN